MPARGRRARIAPAALGVATPASQRSGTSSRQFGRQEAASVTPCPETPIWQLATFAEAAVILPGHSVRGALILGKAGVIDHSGVRCDHRHRSARQFLSPRLDLFARRVLSAVDQCSSASWCEVSA